MVVNKSRRTLIGYPLFYGEPGEDADLFVDDFKMALHINHIRDPVESLGLFEVTLRKSANTWFTALTPPLNQDFEQVLIAFCAQFGQAQNPQKLWKEILLIRQRTLDDYLTYRQAFNTAWTIWLQSLPNPGDGVEFLKKEQFTTGLIPTLRLKVESGDPVTYHDAERRAYQKYRKLKCLEEEPLPVLRPREVPIQVSNIAPIPVVPMAAGPSTQSAMIDNEILERLNESLTNLSIHLHKGAELILGIHLHRSWAETVNNVSKDCRWWFVLWHLKGCCSCVEEPFHSFAIHHEDFIVRPDYSYGNAMQASVSLQDFTLYGKVYARTHRDSLGKNQPPVVIQSTSQSVLINHTGRRGGVKDALIPLLDWAGKQIPRSHRKNTSLFLLATAGVRGLPSEDVEWLLDKVWEILERSPFTCKRRWVKVISGVEEAYYGWVALNYKFGRLGRTTRQPTFGALDLGGSSLK
ncbi:hypothetical protein L7F22_028615 [Adiantum nelumboides]|nr:hypothetical protein [Adiantum nelumboides]